MRYSQEEVLQFIEEDDVKFVRLAFCDVFGKQKNVAIPADSLKRAFKHGVAIDGSSIRGFSSIERSDLFLFPNPETLSEMPWRPNTGKVVRMFCDARTPDGEPFENDTRHVLDQACKSAEAAGVEFMLGPEMEFYLFKTDNEGKPTKIPYDDAEYMDIAPADKGENIRREICLMLEQMGIQPESSHHEMGPGQNEIDFRYASAMTAADNAQMFIHAVMAIAAGNGLVADFSSKPLKGKPGNGVHINFSVRRINRAGKDEQMDLTLAAAAGIMRRIREISLFLNPSESSYERLGHDKAPRYLSWSEGNRSQLIRIPAAEGETQRAELRSPDASANPYLAFALLIYAGLEGIEENAQMPPAADFDVFSASEEDLATLEKLPENLQQAKELAARSDFVRQHLPKSLLDAYLNK